jgi:hypothetical protein
MRFRAVFALALLLFAPSAFAQAAPRLFAERDYESYFTPGAFRADSPTYNSVGLRLIAEGDGFANGATTGVDVMPRWDPESTFRFLKVKTAAVARMDVRWDARARAFRYEITAAVFEHGPEEVWLSNNDRLEISPDDRSGGTVRNYYRGVIRRMEQDVDAFDRLYRASAVGQWTLQCFWIAIPNYDVECRATGPDASQPIVYRYKKLNLTS